MSDDNYDPLSEFLAAERQALGAEAEQFQQSSAAPADAMDVDTSMFVPPEEPSMALEDTPVAPVISHRMPMDEQEPSSQLSTMKIASPGPSEFQKEWQNKNQGLIEERDRQSLARHEEVVNEAKEAVDKFYAEYNEKRERAVKENRNNQEIEVQSVSKGNLWERVWKQIDLATRAGAAQESRKSTSPAAAAGNSSPFAQRSSQPQQLQQQVVTRDTSRMRELLQDLKRDDNAPGVKTRKVQSTA
ncbi:Clathrin light chain [Coemansia erecta]|nr:Clathrin light chain [Coemansia erecta]